MHDRLYRSRDERVIFGVCGGIADQLDVDPSLVRIAFALLVVTAGIGLALYIIMAIVVPEEPDYVTVPAPAPAPGDPAAGAAGGVDAADPSSQIAAGGASAGGSWAADRAARREARRAARAAVRGSREGRGPVILGAILVLVGAWFLVRRYIPALDSDFLGPIVLIVIGALLVGGAVSRKSDDTPRPPR